MRVSATRHLAAVVALRRTIPIHVLCMLSPTHWQLWHSDATALPMYVLCMCPV